jgi:hypothetical protein
MKWKRNPLYVPYEDRFRNFWERGEHPSDQAEEDPDRSGPPEPPPKFGPRARVAIALASGAVIAFWIVRGSYVAAAVTLALLVANEILVRRFPH